jgi:hypothetical protein
MHRHYYHYVEGDHVLQVVVEPCREVKTGRYYEILAEESFSRWQPPFDGDPIPAERIAKIKQRVLDALKFMDIEYQVDRS